MKHLHDLQKIARGGIKKAFLCELSLSDLDDNRFKDYFVTQAETEEEAEVKILNFFETSENYILIGVDDFMVVNYF